MNCQYADNQFCSLLSDESRNALCGHCHIKRYRQRQWLARSYWADNLVLMLEGLLVFGDGTGDDGKFSTNGIASSGAIICTGNYVDDMPPSVSDRSCVTITPCAVAVFDTDHIAERFNDDIEFVKAVFKISMRGCSNEKMSMLKEIGSKDAYAAVRYVIEYCQRHCVQPPLTHEQIAMVCNRSRTTVTEMMHKLLKKEPELFR